MIQSRNEKFANYYKFGDMFGVTKVRAKVGLDWGKLWMIQFLERLGSEWGRDLYWQDEISENWADIPLGNISREGGGPLRSEKLRFNGHKSHRCG